MIPREAVDLSGLTGRFVIRAVAFAVLLTVLNGCIPEAGTTAGTSLAAILKKTGDALREGTNQDYDPPDYTGPPLAELPIYRVGDSYTYSSGRTETIESIDGEQVFWRNDLKAAFERYRNFVLPTVRTRTERGEIVRSFGVAPDVLWPLVPGTRRQIAEEVRIQVQGEKNEQLFRRDWVCTVEGQEKVSVQFGEFDAVKISCDRYARARWREKRTWFYVPGIGHFVRRVETFQDRPSRTVELVSIQQGLEGMSRNAKRAMYDLEQQTLERMPSGKSAKWRSTDGAIAVTMTVTRTMRTEAGQFCRTFQQEITAKEGNRLVPGLACRTWNGRWVRL